MNEISIFELISAAEQAGLNITLSETPQDRFSKFLRHGPFINLHSARQKLNISIYMYMKMNT